MKLVINLMFRGQCRPAFEHYARIFGGEIKAMIPFADAPGDGMPESLRQTNGIMHAWLDIGDQSLMGCDTPPGRGEDMAGFSASFHSPDVAECRRVFDALAEDGKPHRPFGATFWSPGFGVVTDRFGTPWTINATSTAPH